MSKLNAEQVAMWVIRSSNYPAYNPPHEMIERVTAFLETWRQSFIAAAEAEGVNLAKNIAVGVAANTKEGAPLMIAIAEAIDRETKP